MNQQDQQDSVYTSRTDKPRRQGSGGGWRQGFSKKHRIPCATCGGLLHARGHHLQPDHVKLLLAKQQRERERAAACGAGQVVQAG